MAIPFWYDDPASWDRVEIDEFKFEELPVTVDGDLGNELDIKKSPGADGAPSVNKGYEPCQPKLQFVMWTREHWVTYQEFLAKKQPKPGKVGPQVVNVVYVTLQLHKKERFKIRKIHIPKKAGPGQYMVQVDLVEYFPDPKPLPKPVTSKEKDDEKDYPRYHEAEIFRPSDVSTKTPGGKV